jgi:tRNA A-37 threonylcarbamoyl transferase component Bud32
MAEIYKAMDLAGDGRDVAIKMFRPDVLTDALVVEAFRRETEAIRNCIHPNIVQLLGSGIDQESSRHFLVLEWMPENLEEYLKRETFKDWDQFYAACGRPLLDALALAHARQVVHRDIKPTNILMDETGSPKLADFSIAKLKSWHDEGVTLSEFASRPYSSPEHGAESTYSQDLFSYAVLAVRCLSPAILSDYDSVHAALRGAPIPEAVKAELNSCLGEAEERPILAGLLLSALDAIDEERRYRDKLRTPIYLLSSGRVTERVRQSLSIRPQEVQQAILNDLKETPALGTSSGSPPTMELYGGEFQYRVSVARSSADYLMLEDAHRHPAAYMEFRKDKAFSMHCEWRFGRPTRAQEAASALAELVTQFQNHQAEARLAEATARENELFDMWYRTLRAKTQVERDRQPAIPFSGFRLDGSRLVFSLFKPAPEGIIGTPQQVRRDGRALIRGEVDATSESELVMRLQEMDTSVKSLAGELVFDASLASIAIERQIAALNSIRYLRCVRPELRNFLVFPGEVELPEISATPRTFFKDGLSPDKQIAVLAALGASDMLLVEGPPGTGKTTFITEVILQTLADNPHARILLTSQTHVALDHVIGAVQRTGNLVSTVRIGRVGDTRISPVAGEFLLENKMETWRQEALQSGRSYLQQLAARVNISLSSIQAVIQLKRLQAERRRSQGLGQKVQELESDLARTSAAAADLNAMERRELAQEAKILRDQTDESRLDLSRSRRIVLQLREEAIAGGLPEAILTGADDEAEKWVNQQIPDTVGSRLLRRLVDLHADWEMLCGRTPDFQQPILSSVQLVAGTCVGIDSSKGTRDVPFDLCIIDEASKASSTELLVPMSKAKRWLIVGDDRQLPPFIDDKLIEPKLLAAHDLNEDALRNTLFSHLKNGLPEQCHVELHTQHRMIPAIGDLVSHCFYDDKLKSEDRARDSRLAAVLPKPVVWFTTAKMKNRGETPQNPSFTNQLEVRIIARILDAIEKQAAVAQASYSVGVLTGYAAQKSALERTLASRLGTGRNLRIECNTVDAFQGREVDIVIYSVTRSNPKHKLVFLGEMRRLNVALSRGREYLVLVGDHHFCHAADEPNPLRPVITYLLSHPQSCEIIEERA